MESSVLKSPGGNTLSGGGNKPMLRFVGNEELDEAAREKAKLEAIPVKKEEVLGQIGAHIKGLWADAYQAKQDIEDELQQNLRQRRGLYSPSELRSFDEEGVPPVFIKITDAKARATEAWLSDIMGKSGEEAYALEPTPIPDLGNDRLQAMYAQAWQMMSVENLPPEQVHAMMKQAKEQLLEETRKEARTRAEKHTRKIQDQLVESNFEDVFAAFLRDLSTFKNAFINGPVYRRRKTLKWGKNNVPQVEKELVQEFERVSPFDVYPLARSIVPDDGYFIRRRMTRQDLLAMRGIDGNNTDAINEVLDTYESGLKYWIYEWGDERERSEKREGFNDVTDRTIEVLEYNGTIGGKTLREYGMSEKQIPDQREEYDVQVMQVAHLTIRVVLNGDPLGRKPLSKASVNDIPGSFWGEALADLMEDLQKMCNVAGRALAENMGMASGPQVGVDVSRAPEGADLTTIKPWKVWPVASSQNGNGQLPLHFFQPDLHSDALMNVIDKYSQYADEVTGIPKYSYGGDVSSGAASTASGLSMLMSAASKGIKNIVLNVDQNVIHRIINRMYIHNMLYEEDESIKGDLRVQSQGITAMLQKETLNMRRTEFMQMTLNPVDQQIMGLSGRAKMLRDQVDSLEYDDSDIIPTDEELEARMKQAAQQQAAPQSGGQPAAPQQAGPDGGVPGEVTRSQ